MVSLPNALGPVGFNRNPSTVMYVDLNSCFATIEQQANHLYRGRPIAVAAYTTDNGCIVAPSVEAKALGIKTGMSVKDGRQLCPDLIVVMPDPWKYRWVNRKMLALFRRYSDSVQVKSIDEMNIDFGGTLALGRGLATVGAEIKAAIKKEIGDWLTVSVGIAPSRFLAKMGASLHKPDGLDEINAGNIREVLGPMDLTRLFGIKERNKARLFAAGIYTTLHMLDADPQTLMAAFQSIDGYYWHLRLHGWEPDDVIFSRKSIGHSHALRNQTPNPDELAQLLCKLSEKVGARMRHLGYAARGVYLAALYADDKHWHRASINDVPLYASRDIYQKVMRMYSAAPTGRRIHSLGVSCYALERPADQQLSLLEDEQKKLSLTKVLDTINDRWGDFTMTPARMMGMDDTILDRISYGGVKDLEEFVYREETDVEDIWEVG